MLRLKLNHVSKRGPWMVLVHSANLTLIYLQTSSWLKAALDVLWVRVSAVNLIDWVDKRGSNYFESVCHKSSEHDTCGSEMDVTNIRRGVVLPKEWVRSSQWFTRKLANSKEARWIAKLCLPVMAHVCQLIAQIQQGHACIYNWRNIYIVSQRSTIS